MLRKFPVDSPPVSFGRRASQVDPDAERYWWADMGVSGGPLLGPFRSRSEALVAERELLAERARVHVARDTPFKSNFQPTHQAGSEVVG